MRFYLRTNYTNKLKITDLHEESMDRHTQRIYSEYSNGKNICVLILFFKLTYGSKFLKVNGSEFAKKLEGIVFAFSAAGGVNTNLSHMSVTAILMIRNYGDLQHESAQRLHIAIFNGYLHPAIRLGQIDDL